MRLADFLNLRTGDQVVRIDDPGGPVRGNVKDTFVVNRARCVICTFDDSVIVRYWEYDPKTFARLERYRPTLERGY